MLKRFKTRKPYTYKELTVPEGCRELTDEEAFKINGGGKEQSDEQKSSPDSQSPQGSQSSSVTVQSGDTLSELTESYNKANGTNYTYNDIAKMNGITDPDKIYPGQTINFPSNSTQTKTTSTQAGMAGTSSSASSRTEQGTASTASASYARQSYPSTMGAIKTADSVSKKSGITGTVIMGDYLVRRELTADGLVAQTIVGQRTPVNGKKIEAKDEDEARTKLYQAAAFIISHAETEDEKATAKAVEYMMNNKKVQLDTLVTRHEKADLQHFANETGITDFYHNTETGKERGIIVIDTKYAADNPLGNVIRTLAHEGWHVVQHETGFFDITEENSFRLHFHREPGRTITDYHTDLEYEAFCMGFNMNNKYNMENGIHFVEPYSWEKVRSICTESRKR